MLSDEAILKLAREADTENGALYTEWLKRFARACYAAGVKDEHDAAFELLADARRIGYAAGAKAERERIAATPLELSVTSKGLGEGKT
ncbi:MAG TPA: hypothetical protein VGM15_03115 [Burkholderiaceae bacterium]|jgi:hypothetical protein